MTGVCRNPVVNPAPSKSPQRPIDNLNHDKTFISAIYNKVFTAFDRLSFLMRFMKQRKGLPIVGFSRLNIKSSCKSCFMRESPQSRQTRLTHRGVPGRRAPRRPRSAGPATMRWTCGRAPGWCRCASASARAASRVSPGVAATNDEARIIPRISVPHKSEVIVFCEVPQNVRLTLTRSQCSSLTSLLMPRSAASKQLLVTATGISRGEEDQGLGVWALFQGTFNFVLDSPWAKQKSRSRTGVAGALPTAPP